jgi:hypothetical protein
MIKPGAWASQALKAREEEVKTESTITSFDYHEDL